MKDKIRIAMEQEKDTALSTFYWRIKMYGSPFKKQDGREKHFIDGRRAMDVAKENGIPDKVFRARIKAGWTVCRSATQPVRMYKGKSNE